MEILLKELRDARLHATAGEMEAAKQHMDDALDLLDDALARRPGPKLWTRAIRGYIAEAGFALTQSDSRRAESALSETLVALENSDKKEE